MHTDNEDGLHTMKVKNIITHIIETERERNKYFALKLHKVAAPTWPTLLFPTLVGPSDMSRLQVYLLVHSSNISLTTLSRLCACTSINTHVDSQRYEEIDADKLGAKHCMLLWTKTHKKCMQAHTRNTQLTETYCTCMHSRLRQKVTYPCTTQHAFAEADSSVCYAFMCQRQIANLSTDISYLNRPVWPGRLPLYVMQ